MIELIRKLPDGRYIFSKDNGIYFSLTQEQVKKIVWLVEQEEFYLRVRDNCAT